MVIVAHTVYDEGGSPFVEPPFVPIVAEQSENFALLVGRPVKINLGFGLGRHPHLQVDQQTVTCLKSRAV